MIRHVFAVQTVPPTRTLCEMPPTSLSCSTATTTASPLGVVKCRICDNLIPTPTPTLNTREVACGVWKSVWEIRDRNSKCCPRQARRERSRLGSFTRRRLSNVTDNQLTASFVVLEFNSTSDQPRTESRQYQLYCPCIGSHPTLYSLGAGCSH